ncbi:hypothetical protein ACF0H5_023274 [Mactra antiquata]
MYRQPKGTVPALDLQQLALLSQYRRSVYWVDYPPPRPGPNGTTEIIATPRVQDLARHRPPHNAWKGDRPSPVGVCKQALTVTHSPRIDILSVPTSLSSNFNFRRTLPVAISPAALKASTTPVIERLAVPRYTQADEEERLNDLFVNDISSPLINDDTKYSQPIGKRLLAMSLPKLYLSDVNKLPFNLDPYSVKPEALQASVTPRIVEISKPRHYHIEHDIYDPYKVSDDALKAKCSSRIQELCQPLCHKIQNKKLPKILKKKPFRL